jgi:signal transduction histidine kinase
MAETATEWSEHDLGRRFDLGPPDNEISALASTLDTLLDKVSSAIRSEQRLTSELAHELRTPLTTIQGLADLMLLRDVLPPDAARDLEEISAASQRMAATITALLELARNEASVVASSHCSLAEVLAEVTQGLDAGDTELTVPTSDVLLDLPHALAVRALSPVVENAFRYARSRVTVSFQPAAAGMVQVLVDDDGPGVDADRTSLIFEPGTTSGTSAGAGLGLAIARRIARSVGGDVEVAPDAPVTRFVITLPRA